MLRFKNRNYKNQSYKLPRKPLAWMPFADVLSLQEPGRQLLWTGMNILHHLTCDCTKPCRYWDHLLIIKEISWQLQDMCTPSKSPPETRAPLLQRNNIQLKHRGPHQPLLTVEVRPTQRFVRQVPQAFHEGSVTFIQTWDASSGRNVNKGTSHS